MCMQAAAVEPQAAGKTVERRTEAPTLSELHGAAKRLLQHTSNNTPACLRQTETPALDTTGEYTVYKVHGREISTLSAYSPAHTLSVPVR